MGMVVIQAKISVSKLKKIKTKFLRYTGNQELDLAINLAL